MIKKPNPSHAQPGTRLATGFRATCRLTRSVPERKMTPELWETAHAAEYRREFKEMGSERVDRGTGRHGRWEIVFAACEGFDTTDREAYLEHMATLHNRKPGGPLQIKLGRGHWRAPKLYDAGAPFKAPDGLTETCASCGLVSEIPPKPLDSPYRDHVEHCPGMKREVA